MKNIFSFAIVASILFLYSCKPKPELNIVVSGSFKVSPNVEKIYLGDTLKLNLNIDANFPLVL